MLPPPRTTVVAAKFAVVGVWRLLLGAYIYLFGCPGSLAAPTPQAFNAAYPPTVLAGLRS